MTFGSYGTVVAPANVAPMDDTPTTLSSRGQPNTTTQQTFHITGMSCAQCVRAVLCEVQALAGVLDAQVDGARAAVTITSSQQLNTTMLATAVHDAGCELDGVLDATHPAYPPNHPIRGAERTKTTTLLHPTTPRGQFIRHSLERVMAMLVSMDVHKEARR